MKFGAPIISTILSGSLNGIVGSKARGGIGYFRTRVIPGNPRTYAQDVVRGVLTSIASAWKNTLTTTQRTNWAAIAKPGEQGINRYTAANTIVMQGGQARQDTAPASPDLPWLVIPPAGDFVVDNTAKLVKLTGLGTSYIGAGAYFSFYIQDRTQPASRNHITGNMIYLGSVISSGVAPSVAIPTATQAKFGYAAGKSSFIKVLVFKTTGEVSSEITNLVLQT